MKNKLLLFSFWTTVCGCLLICWNCVSQDQKKPVPLAGKPWSLSLKNDKKLDLMWIAPGKLIMGSPDSEPGRKGDEGPQTEVTLTRGYWLAKTEVTIGQWKAVMGLSLREHVIKMLEDESLYDFGSGVKQKLRDYMHFDRNDPDKIIANDNDQLPMYFVSWYDAVEFCQRLTQQERSNDRLPEGYEYLLPTEAQWEYACRAGTAAASFAGPLIVDGGKASVLDNICWYSGNSFVGYIGKKLGNSSAGPRNVGKKEPNPWGLLDMTGNLWEWCRDAYGTYPGAGTVDLYISKEAVNRVNRGGSWGSGAHDQRSARRASNPAAEKSAYRGFRVALCSKL